MRQAAIPARTSACVLTLIVLTTVNRTALAEDERSACATAAEQAQELRISHRLKESREKLVECSKPSCPTVVSQDCNQWLSEVNALVPSLLIQAKDSGGRSLTAVRVWIDGRLVVDQLNGDAIAVDPGNHHLRFEADAKLPVDLQITAAEGEVNRPISVQLAPQRPPAPLASTTAPTARSSRLVTALPYALASVGVVALGGFAYYGIKGTSEADDLAAGCGANKTCSESQVDPVRRHLLIADISLGLSLVSLGAATWMFVHRSASKPKHAPPLQVGVAPGSGVLKLNVAF